MVVMSILCREVLLVVVEEVPDLPVQQAAGDEPNQTLLAVGQVHVACSPEVWFSVAQGINPAFPTRKI